MKWRKAPSKQLSVSNTGMEPTSQAATHQASLVRVIIRPYTLLSHYTYATDNYYFVMIVDLWRGQQKLVMFLVTRPTLVFLSRP